MVYLIFALFLCILDLFIKQRIEARKDSAFPIQLKGGFSLEKHHNRGFILNRLDDRPKLVRAVSFLVFLPLSIWILRLCFKKDSCFAEKLGAAGLLGGAASNFYDRIFRGYVVDYLRLPIKKIRNIIFNIADFFIFIGTALVAVCSLFTK